MKVKELIKQLKKLDQDAEVVVCEYNGWDDAYRGVRHVRASQKVNLAQDAVRRLSRCHNFVAIGAIKGS